MPDKSPLAPSRHVPTPLLRALKPLAILALGIFAGRLGSSEPLTRAAPADAGPSHAADVPQAAIATAPLPTPKCAPGGATSAPSDEERAEQERAAQRERARTRSRLFLGSLQRRIDTLQEQLPEQRPELLVNQLDDYMKGWSDALTDSPEFTNELAEQVTNTLCSEQSKDTRSSSKILYARLINMKSELASDEALDCYFDHVRGEGPELWEGILAWKVSGLPKPSAIEELERGAASERTRSILHLDSERQAYATRRPVPLDRRGLPIPSAESWAAGAPSTPGSGPDGQ
jgi:hypothetical protein